MKPGVRQVQTAGGDAAASRFQGTQRCPAYEECRRREDALRASREEARVAEQRRQAAVLEERLRLARDIHDTLAQGLTGIIVQLEAAQEAIRQGEPREVGRRLRLASALARSSLGDTRRSVFGLRPQALERAGLARALERLIGQMTRGTGLCAQLALEGQPRPLSPEREEHLLRIGQETLTNTLKHGRASRFEARLVFTADEVRLEVADNGRGFGRARHNGGLGLTGMAERAKRLGGRLTVSSAVGRGTRVLVVLPDHPGMRGTAL